MANWLKTWHDWNPDASLAVFVGMHCVRMDSNTSPCCFRNPPVHFSWSQETKLYLFQRTFSPLFLPKSLGIKTGQVSAYIFSWLVDTIHLPFHSPPMELQCHLCVWVPWLFNSTGIAWLSFFPHLNPPCVVGVISGIIYLPTYLSMPSISLSTSILHLLPLCKYFQIIFLSSYLKRKNKYPFLVNFILWIHTKFHNRCPQFSLLTIIPCIWIPWVCSQLSLPVSPVVKLWRHPFVPSSTGFYYISLLLIFLSETLQTSYRFL